MLEWGMPSKLVVPYNGVILAIGIPEDILKTYYNSNNHNNDRHTFTNTHYDNDANDRKQ